MAIADVVRVLCLHPEAINLRLLLGVLAVVLLAQSAFYRNIVNHAAVQQFADQIQRLADSDPSLKELLQNNAPQTPPRPSGWAADPTGGLSAGLLAACAVLFVLACLATRSTLWQAGRVRWVALLALAGVALVVTTFMVYHIKYRYYSETSLLHMLRAGSLVNQAADVVDIGNRHAGALAAAATSDNARCSGNCLSAGDRQVLLDGIAKKAASLRAWINAERQKLRPSTGQLIKQMLTQRLLTTAAAVGLGFGLLSVALVLMGDAAFVRRPQIAATAVAVAGVALSYLYSTSEAYSWELANAMVDNVKTPTDQRDWLSRLFGPNLLATQNRSGLF